MTRPTAQHNSPRRIPQLPVREKTRPTRPLQRHFREKVRPATGPLVLNRDKVRPARGLHGLNREKLRPAQGLHGLNREKLRPARHKTPILGHFSCAGRTFSRSVPPSDRAGRTFSRTGHSHVATVKPTSPLHPKTAPKTSNSHPQRRQRFQLRLDLRTQRRWQFQTSGPPGRQGLAAAPRAAVGPNRHTFACNSPVHISCFEM